MPAMNLRLISPELIVDIGELAELRGIAVRGETLVIGALTRHVDLLKSPEIASARAAAGRGDRACRASRDPQSRHDRRQPCARRSGLRTAGLHAGARRNHHCARPGRRAADRCGRIFHRHLRDRTCRRRNCWSRSNCRSRERDSAHFFHEFARRHGDYAIVGLAAQASIAGRQVHRSPPRLLCRGRSACCWRRPPAKLIDVDVTPAVLAEASAVLGAELDPQEDQQASPAMRRHLAKVLLSAWRGRAACASRSRRRGNCVTAAVPISLEVNGERVEAHVLPRLNLADFLREHLQSDRNACRL